MKPNNFPGRYADMRICGCADVQICGCADLRIQVPRAAYQIVCIFMVHQIRFKKNYNSMKKVLYFLVIGQFTFSLAAFSQGGGGVKNGMTAPNFTGKNQNGEMISLSQYKGGKVVLYFYPKDDTPGCTAEACSIRDNYDSLTKAG